jgi:CheY-like chemotaxis protein
MATGHSSPGPAIALGTERDPNRRREVQVLVVDDQETFRLALRDLIDRVRGFTCVGEAASGEEATRAVAALSPHLVLMDVIMPGMGGIAAAWKIVARESAPAVVLISVHDPALYPGVESLCGRVAFVRKQDLRPARLAELWEQWTTNPAGPPVQPAPPPPSASRHRACDRSTAPGS